MARLNVIDKIPALNAETLGSPASLERGKRSGAFTQNFITVTTSDFKRPVRKSHVQALEAEIAALKRFIRKLRDSTTQERDKMLMTFESSSQPVPAGQQSPLQGHDNLQKNSVVARIRNCQLKKRQDGCAAQFYGSTSLLQMPEGIFAPLSSHNPSPSQNLEPTYDMCGPVNFQYSPQHPVTQELMAAFFTEQYQQNMCVYREFFLEDYRSGDGRFYSEALLYSICSMGALVTTNPERKKLSDLFSRKAQSLIFSSLGDPSLPTLQSLTILSQVEIGCGRSSRGWLLSGMTSRLAHEMGLHLDPKNWDSLKESSTDQEILRRVYWAIFIVDTQLSLFFGRPPSLFPHKSDVHKTIRLPYSPEWVAMLLNSDKRDGALDTVEDGAAFVGAFIHRVELYKIMHVMITEVFENHHENTQDEMLDHKTQHLHASLIKWSADLPGKLHWNKWTVGDVPASVLHLQ